MSQYTLMDCHVHLEEIIVHDEIAAKRLGMAAGEKRWKGISINKYLEHISKDNLNTIFGIYEHPENIRKLRDRAKDCEIKGMFWPRNPQDPSLMDVCNDFYEEGVLQALKAHPICDNYEFTTDNLKYLLIAARRFNIPILYHSDDRTATMHLTSPENQKAVIEENPDVIFIIGHGGAYANPRMVGNNPISRGYWDGQNSRRKLIHRALELSYNNDNCFYDLTICTNRIKAQIISDFVASHPKMAEKILVGTDFPIKCARAQSQIKALEKSGLGKKYVERIAVNRI